MSTIERSLSQKDLLPEVILKDPILDDSIHTGGTPLLVEPTPLSELEQVSTELPPTGESLELEILEDSEVAIPHMGRIGSSSFNKAVSKLIAAGFPKELAESIVENNFFSQMEVMSNFVEDPQKVLSELSKQMQKIREALDGMEKQKVGEGSTSYFKGTFYV